MITICSTIPPFALMSDKGYWHSWLENAEAVQASVDVPVQYFCAIEIDARGLKPFGALLDRLAQIGGSYWTFSFDDGSTHVHTNNRLVRITTGQNLASHYAMVSGASHELFLAADTRIPDDALPRLLELEWPICALDTPTYCLSRLPDARPLDATETGYPASWDVWTHMASAACLFRSREIFRQLRWRVDGDAGMTDDPCMHHDAKTLLGYETRVRHDHLATHFPEAIGPVETRHPAENMRWHRDG